MAHPRCYIDHNAGTALLDEARQAAFAAMDLTGNASSIHAEGRTVRQVIEGARANVAALAGAEPRQVVFTSSASEAIAQAIIGASALGVGRLIISEIEHPAVFSAADMAGVELATVGVSTDGVIDIACLREALEAAGAAGQIALVCIHWVHNETGVVQPVDAVGALVGPTPHYLFIDAVQAFGKRDLDFSTSPADMMAISAHKIGGLAGAGALLVKPHADTVRLMPGGGQEQGRRRGTEALVPIAAFGAAARAFAARYAAARTADLAAAFEAQLHRVYPQAVVFGANGERVGNTVYFGVPGLEAAVALMSLDLAGIALSSGSACSSGKVSAGRTLKAMAVDPRVAKGALRASFGWTSHERDVTALIEELERLAVRKIEREPAA